MEFWILGPLEVRADKREIPLGGVKPRTLLAVLLLRANEPVSAERLALALWGEDAPPAAVRTVQVYVSRLRKALGGGNVLETTAAGYRLNVRPGELDRERFEDLVDAGRGALAADDPQRAADVLREALGLWRGPPLAELTFQDSVHADVARLEEQRLEAVEARVEADLAAGREAEIVGELRQLVAAHPTRERLAGQLMLALYRSGRQADALEAYNRARRRLVDEAGVEPGPELRRLQDAILHQDAALDAAPAVAELPSALDPASAPALEGRGSELAWLSERWEATRTGVGALVTLAGEHGAGKTRLAAELAAEVHAEGAAVLYAAAGGAPEPALGAIARARAASAPTLLVVDDVDRASERVQDALADVSRGAPVLALGTGADADALRRVGGDAALQLAPLGLDAVRAIGAAHAPPNARDEVPADWLLEASGGIARRVHTLASQWARREAAARVGKAAGRTAAGRAELRSMEAELAADVAELEATREPDAAEDEVDATVVCPFKGLASFQAADARYFFGRERLVAALVARLVGSPVLGIVGPSGSGKSSVLRAGLLPALAGGVLPGSGDARQVVVRPGAHPLRELRRALDDAGEDGSLVLAVDQFEETFTRCRDEAERAGFVEEILGLADDRATVIVAVRADHYGRCAAYPALSGVLAANHVLVGPMRTDELRRAVVCPARRAGLVAEPDLVDAVVADVEGEPGALPLLSTALLELWQRRDGRRLRHADYERTGGVHGAVARLAEDAYGRLDDHGQATARRVLLRLADVRDDGSVERRRPSLADLGADDDRDVAGVVALLADSRLLTVSAGTVELAHEALLREWPRLRGWIDDDRDVLRLERSLSVAAEEWERLDRDDGALLRGARLAEARLATERGALPLPSGAREFLDASLARFRRDRAARRRRLTFAFAALAVGLVAITVVAGIAVHQAGQARDERDTAVSKELALQAQNEVANDPQLAMSLALSALESAKTQPADAALRQATLASHQLRVYASDPLRAWTAAYSPDGTSLVTGGQRGIVSVRNVATGRLVAALRPGHRALNSARYAPDGRRIVLGFTDGSVLVTDAHLRHPRTALRVGKAQVLSVAFSGDGSRLAAGLSDGTVHIGTIGGGPWITLAGRSEKAVQGVDLDNHGRRAIGVSDDGTVRLWEGTGGEPPRVIFTSTRSEQDAQFSPDGSRIAVAGFDGQVRLFDGRSGAATTRLDGGGHELYSVGFSRDGRRVAAGSLDGATRVWSVRGDSPLTVLRGTGGRVYDVSFGPRDDRLLTANADGTARTWDAGSAREFVGTNVTDDVELDRSGRRVVTGSEDGTVRLWDVESGRVIASDHGTKGYTIGRFAPDGDKVVIGRGGDSTISIWSLTGPPKTVVRLGEGHDLNMVRFDRTGRRLIYADATGVVATVDLHSHRVIRFRGAGTDVTDVQLSPDGRRAAAATRAGKVFVWTLAHPSAPDQVLKGHHDRVASITYSADGRLASAGADRTIRVWDRSARRSVVLRGADGEMTTVVFTRDGDHILGASADGTLRLWDPRASDPLVVVQTGAPAIYDVAQSANGTIVTVDGNEVTRTFTCNVCGSLASVRRVADARHPHRLTPAERDRFAAAGN